MEFSIKSGNPEKQRTACVVVGIFEPRRLSAAGEQIDKVSRGYIANIIRRGDIEGKQGQTLLLHNVPNMLCDRVLLVGCGRERDFNENNYIKTVRTAVKTLNDTGSMDAVCFLPDLPIKGRDIYWKVRQCVQSSEDELYVFDELKTSKDKKRRPIRKMTLNVASRRDLAKGEKALEDGQAIAAGISMTKTLGNLPGNICTPTYLAKQAKGLTKVSKKLTVDVLDEAEIKKLGMGSFLSVAKGSRQAPKLIVMEYNGGKKGDKPHVLIGKGITFDSGGISIKPSPAMDEMKYDMGGAASVIGTMKAVMKMKLPLNVVAIIPSCENMPDGLANKPGDIVTSMSGQTIEILNTDAEGRLILCDALTYSEKYDPASVIDIATLTGACVVALGKHVSGLLGNNRTVVNRLIDAGQSSHDRAWELPLWEEYQDQLKSNFADMANIGGPEGGTITAACFLSRFAKKLKWAHLDIAGTAWLSNQNKGGTGRPVSLLTQYLMDRAGK